MTVTRSPRAGTRQVLELRPRPPFRLDLTVWALRRRALRGLGRLHVFPQSDVGALNGLRRFLTAAGRDDDPQAALARFSPDAGLVYFHLLLRGLEQQGVLD